jgi:hypothetical protein
MGEDRWIERTVEKVKFADAFFSVRRASVDFELPAFARVLDPAIVPIALLHKQPPLEALDIRDESGRSLSLLSRRENSFIAYSTLAAAAEATLGRRPSESLLQRLWTVAKTQTMSAEKAMEEFRDSRDQDEQTLYGTLGFQILLANLTENFILLVRLDDRPHARRIVKYCYLMPIAQRKHSRWSRFRGMMNWRPTLFGFEIGGVGNASSFHVEIEPPEGVEVIEGRFRSRSAIQTDADVDAVPRSPTDRHPRHLVHLYLAGRDRAVRAEATVSLLAPRPGLVRRAAFLTAINALIMCLGAWQFPLLTQALDSASTDAAVALLLLGPSAASAYLARPGEHSLTSRLVFGVRLATLLSGLAVFLAAVALILDPAVTWGREAWSALAGAAVLLAVGVGRSHWPSTKPQLPRVAADNGDSIQ